MPHFVIGFLVCAVIAAAVAIFLWWMRTLAIRNVALMNATPISRAADIGKMAPGTIVEATGIVECDSLLTGEFSLKPCVYFEATITREEQDFSTDSEGRQTSTTRTVTVHSNKQHASCLLHDDSGSVGLDLDGAQVEAIRSIDSYGPPDTVKSAGFFASLAANSNRYMESLLPAGTPIFVLGEVHAGGGIGAPLPGSANKVFVVTYKSKEKRGSDMSKKIKYSFIGAVAFATIAVVFLALSIC